MKYILALICALSITALAGTNTLTGTNIVPSGSTFTSASGSSFTVSGSLTLPGGITITGVSGTGNVVLSNSPTFTTPTLGAASATSVNGVTITSSTGTLSIANGKTFTMSNSIGFSGQDGSFFTLPNESIGAILTADSVETVANKTFSLCTIDLSNSGNTVTYMAPNGPAVSLVSSIIRLSRSPMDYGAKWDGSSHPLSSVYGSLSAAQNAFSFTIGASTTNGSPTVACASTLGLQTGWVIMGSGIPAGTTISSITDATHFVLSANATATASVNLTSSFVTSLTQELDWAATQQAEIVFGSINLPIGVGVFGNSTLRTWTTLASFADGVTIAGAGPAITTITSTGDAIHIMGRYQKAQNFSLVGPGSVTAPTFTSAQGITLGEGYYFNNFHMNHCNISNYAFGFRNPNGWDACSIEDSYIFDNFCNVSTSGNQDFIGLTTTTLSNDSASNDGTFAVAGCATTNGSTTITCPSGTPVFLGQTVAGSGINDWSYVSSITDATHFVIDNRINAAAATATASPVTISLSTIGLACDNNGAANWDKGVSGGNGVSIAGGGVVSEKVHFEGAHKIYVNGVGSGKFTFHDCQFADGGTAYQHVSVQSMDVEVTGCGVTGAGISGSNGRVYVYMQGGGGFTGMILSPDHTAVENYNGIALVICGDYYIQSGDNTLPTADSTWDSRRVLQAYSPGHWNSPTHIFTNFNDAGTYHWHREDGLVADTSGTVLTNIATGTTGAATINFLAGSVNFAATDTSLVVTDSLVTTSSNIQVTILTHDLTLTSAQAVPGSGSFTIYGNAAATAETRVSFRILNQ